MAKKKASTPKNKRPTKPISWKEIKKALLYLEQEEKYHYLLIIGVGVFTGYRISDMLDLRYSDFDGEVLDITERKTTKQRKVKIVPELRRIVKKCQEQLNCKNQHHLFIRERFFSDTPITKSAAITRIRKALQFTGIKGRHLSAHTLRKTFALRYYTLMEECEGSYRALLELSKQLNHTNTETTRRYIGIQEKVIEDVFNKFY